jgi:prepilin-type N-terminal cleavage/methylation domain-containing protein/prepilin-type processing-associated H-X9-DG protein
VYHLKRRVSAAAAFTLIELLVVVAIIAILAGLLLPAFGRMQVIGDRAKCASNLRQVGASIGAYVGEHDGYLPGPLWTWQNPWYQNGDYGSLAMHLQKYLKLPPKESSPALVAEVMMCPAWNRGAPYAEDERFVQYAMNSHPGETCRKGCTEAPGNPPTDPQCRDPWGDALIRDKNGGDPDPDPFAGDKPLPLASLPTRDADGNPISAATIWAMQDYDKQSSISNNMCPQVPTADVIGTVVDTPVHKDVRNTLFFDFHVEAIKVPTRRPVGGPP